jgi:hypothetical protein
MSEYDDETVGSSTNVSTTEYDTKIEDRLSVSITSLLATIFVRMIQMWYHTLLSLSALVSSEPVDGYS